MIKSFLPCLLGAVLLFQGQGLADSAPLASITNGKSLQAKSGRYLYAQGGFGYGFSHWSPDELGDGAALTSQSSQWGGLIWGGQVGYAFNQAVALEAGFYDLAKVRYRTVSDSVRHTLDPNMMYVAARIKVPYNFHHMNIYAKFGPAWRYINRRAEASEIAPKSVNYTTFVSGLGFVVDLPTQITVGFDYLMMPVRRLAGGRVDATRSPAAYLLVANLGYQFNL